ncbi:unnamed protein product [Cyclocybe aegerita]|uniref:Uncharacterized protein n=1 Tax=Cyclocybe aegerita TaxID=1973307 RepID=A0A8S0X5N4_CYCAE|nr:unnamed protein product [Cyclocybe aegerita]
MTLIVADDEEIDCEKISGIRPKLSGRLWQPVLPLAMSNESPIVVAPRPVRLASAFFSRRQDTEDLKVSFFADIRESPSPASAEQPRSLSRSPSYSRPPSSALPSEALDEFLSILRPTFARKPRPAAFPAFLPERPLAFRPLQRIDGPAPADRADLDPRDDHLPTPDEHTEPRQPQQELDVRWFSSSLLSSPISRMHTRNPFQRNHDTHSPVPSPSPLSPAAVPLPAPSPTEFLDTI